MNATVELDDHECTPPVEPDSQVVFYTCPVDNRTWLQDRSDPPQWHEIQ